MKETPDIAAFLRRISLNYGPATASQLLRVAEEIERWRASAESYPLRRAS